MERDEMRPPSVRRAMFIKRRRNEPALRQEGHVYRTRRNAPALRQEGHVYGTRRNAPALRQEGHVCITGLTFPD